MGLRPALRLNEELDPSLILAASARAEPPGYEARCSRLHRVSLPRKAGKRQCRHANRVPRNISQPDGRHHESVSSADSLAARRPKKEWLLAIRNLKYLSGSAREDARRICLCSCGG